MVCHGIMTGAGQTDVQTDERTMTVAYCKLQPPSDGRKTDFCYLFFIFIAFLSLFFNFKTFWKKL